jgi:hypothetical protein
MVQAFDPCRDRTDDNSIVNASQRISAVAASAQSTSCADNDSTFAQETKDILWVFQQMATTAMTSFSGACLFVCLFINRMQP